MKLIFPIIIMIVASSASAGTLNDFFTEHPDLSENLPIHTAISKASRFEAAGFARREGGDEKKLMDTSGDKFAILGFRRVKTSCAYPEAAQVIGLNADDCKLIMSKNL